jgi:hypothetical protein
MELTASFLKNITSFIGDFSGFSNDTTPDDKCYLMLLFPYFMRI